jgi:hypothetical protein
MERWSPWPKEKPLLPTETYLMLLKSVFLKSQNVNVQNAARIDLQRSIRNSRNKQECHPATNEESARAEARLRSKREALGYSKVKVSVEKGRFT